MMRWVIGILLTINLVIFAWGTYIVRSPERARPTVTAAEKNSIRLLSEIKQETSKMETMSTETPSAYTGPEPGIGTDKEETVAEQTFSTLHPLADDETAAVQMLCGSIGPFDREPPARQAQEELQGIGLKSNLLESREQLESGYRVLIPESDTREEAEKMVVRLKQAGIMDVWLFTEGPMENVISLGLYDHRVNAAKRARELATQGFVAEVSPKLEEHLQYWLNFTTEEGEKARSDLAGLFFQANLTLDLCH